MNRCHSIQFSPCHQQGLTLIEILITILVMGFGLLGVAQMQTVSLQSNYESAQRTIATYLADDIIARMRSTPLADLDDYETGSNPIGYKDPDSSPNPSSVADECTAALNCSVSEKISRDLWEWKEALIGTAELKGSTNTGGLLNPSGCIQVDNNQIQVIISWDSIGNAKATDTTSCGTGSDDYTRRSITVFTVL